MSKTLSKIPKYVNTLPFVRLRELLSYDPLTGDFVWVKMPSPFTFRVKVGDVAGCRNKSNGYWHIGIDGHLYRSHRLAWLYMRGVWPSDQLDHIDMDKANNRLANLREATHSQNLGNRRTYANNKLGIKGVSRKSKGFHAQIRIDGKKLCLGQHATPELASDAYAAAAIKYFGDFARTGDDARI